MEREVWTDERLDDLAEAMRNGFTRLDGDVRDLRVELREGLAGVREEIGALRTELVGEIGSLRNEVGGEIGSLRNEVGGEIGSLRNEVGGEIGSLRREIGGEIGLLREELGALKSTMLRASFAGLIALLGILAAVVARGV